MSAGLLQQADGKDVQRLVPPPECCRAPRGRAGDERKGEPGQEHGGPGREVVNRDWPEAEVRGGGLPCGGMSPLAPETTPRLKYRVGEVTRTQGGLSRAIKAG